MTRRLTAAREYTKRALDLLLSSAGLIVLIPLLFGVAIAVRIKLGSPVFFRQLRSGFHGRPFVMYKFRTMSELYAANGEILPDSERLSSFGRMLRSTSVDEFPALYNVLRGDMSLVGPRPLLMEYLPLYSAEQARRHEVRPGLTGWAQVNGRNTLSWEEKFALDVWYVDNRSLRLDLKILLITLWRVLRRHGINQEGNATMERFRGTSA